MPKFNRDAGCQRSAVFRKRDFSTRDLILDVMDLIQLSDLIKLVPDGPRMVEKHLHRIDETLIRRFYKCDSRKASGDSFRVCG